MNETLQKYFNQRDLLRSQLKAAEQELEYTKQELEYTLQARELVRNVASQFQRDFQTHLSSMVSKAMRAVFPDPYQLCVEFVQRRGKMDADISFIRDGEKIDPMAGSGGGAVDVAAFALQLALWSIKKQKTRPTLILEEPLKWLKGDDYPALGAEMIAQISKQLGIQIIMISHIPELIGSADKIFLVEKKGNVSRVEEIQ